MDEIEARLKETSENCLSCFLTWNGDKKNADNRESLQEAVHELRKVASRLEIELAVSDSNELSRKPIPIPSHRDANRRSSGDTSMSEGQERKSSGRRRSPPKKQQQSDGNA